MTVATIEDLDHFTCLAAELTEKLAALKHDREIYPDLANIIQALPILDAEGRKNTRLAIEVADRLTRDEAQNLYHFAVLVTKLYS